MVKTLVTVEPAPLVELHHRSGCPEAEDRRMGDPDDLSNPRKAVGVEAYIVTGTGRYDRVSGTFVAVPLTGVVRCIECATEAIVPPADIPSIQRMLAAETAQEVTHA